MKCPRCGGERYHNGNRWMCRHCRAVNAKRWRSEHPEKWRAARIRQTHSYLDRIIGISWQKYEKLYEEQEGKCTICGKWCERLHIDHDHATGKFRGLLCLSCNSGLGQFGDDIPRLVRAILYLKGQLGSKTVRRAKMVG
jgi:hypothetical protein